MKRLLPLTLSLAFVLAACGVDSTGLSAESKRTPHPKTNPAASVVVQEFADLQCPACRSAHTTLLKPIVEKYGTSIRYEFHHFPLRTIHQFALDAAEAAECAADQGKFWEYIDLDYAQQDQMSKAKLREWAEEAGVADMALFDRCTQSHVKRDEILADYAEGDKMGVQGTPTFFVNGTKVESTMDALTGAIDAQLAAARKVL